MKIAWKSEVVTKHLLGRWLLTPNLMRGEVVGYINGTDRFKVRWDYNYSVEYMSTDDMVGCRVFQSYAELEAAVKPETYPAEVAQYAECAA